MFLLTFHFFFLIEIVSEQIVWTFSTSTTPPLPPPPRLLLRDVAARL